MIIIGERQQELIEWAESNYDCKYRDDAIAIGLEKNGRIVAVSVMDTWSVTGCNIHIVSDKSKTWFNPRFIITVFTYCFVDCDLKRVTGLVPQLNHKAVRFNFRLGFKLEGVMRNGHSDCDLLMLGMLKEECKFIRGVNHG